MLDRVQFTLLAGLKFDQFLNYSKGAVRKERKKEGRVWDNAGSSKDLKDLDFSGTNGKEASGHSDVQEEDVKSLVSPSQARLGATKPVAASRMRTILI